MIYVWCERPSDGAIELTQAINDAGYWAKRRRHAIIRLDKGDTLICWGESYPHQVPEGVLVLNPVQNSDKLRELTTLKEANVPCVAFSSTRTNDFTIGRRRDHQGGSDLLSPPSAPAYWVKKYDFTKEFRVHIIKLGEEYVSIRTGIKVPRGEFANPHPWVKSYDAGWKLDYGSACQSQINNRVRQAAKDAVRALKLDFGAVDVGMLADRSAIVLEANRAPGNEANTSKCYAKHFIDLANKQEELFE